MSDYVRVAAGTPLTDEELSQLRALAVKPDSEIDFSDILERVYPAYNPAEPLEVRTLTLRLDREVAEWLESAGEDEIRHINFLLKRAAHRRRNVRPPCAVLLDKAS